MGCRTTDEQQSNNKPTGAWVVSLHHTPAKEESQLPLKKSGQGTLEGSPDATQRAAQPQGDRCRRLFAGGHTDSVGPAGRGEHRPGTRASPHAVPAVSAGRSGACADFNPRAALPNLQPTPSDKGDRPAMKVTTPLLRSVMVALLA